MATLVETFPQLRPDFNLIKALTQYQKTKNSYAEGYLKQGAFNRDIQIQFQAVMEAPIQRFDFDGKITFTMPLKLGKEEMKAVRTLCNRMVEEAIDQTKEETDQWEFLPFVKADKPWYMKIKLDRQGRFMPKINNGEVTRENYERYGQKGDKANILGTFGIWMNPERGQYGLMFNALEVDF